MDVDEYMVGQKWGGSWRDNLTGEALDLIEAIEQRIVDTGQRPKFSLVWASLTDLGVSVSPSTVGVYFRNYAQRVGVEW